MEKDLKEAISIILDMRFNLVHEIPTMLGSPNHKRIEKFRGEVKKKYPKLIPARHEF